MKRVSIFLFILMACTMLGMAAGKKVAVYVEGNISKADKDVVYSSVLARVSGNKDYTVFERNESFINALTKEQDYQVSGEVPEEEIRAVGERMGVDYVIVLNVIKTRDEKCNVAARLIELVTGKVLKSVNQKREYTGSEVLSNMATNVTYRLIDKKSK